MKFSPYSYSRLSTYSHCPRKFKYVYIDKLEREKTDLTPLLKGSALHSILENYPNESSHSLAQKYKYIIDNFVESNLGKRYLSQNSTREFDFGLNADLQCCSYSDKNALFRGSVDFICVIDNVLHLNDWKSGKYKEPKYQDYNQLMFYGIYFFQRYQSINKIRISYVYIEHDLENSIELDRQYLSTYIDVLMSLINGAENDVSFNKNQGTLCTYCEFEQHCNNN